MKQVILYICIFCAIVFSLGANGHFYVPVEKVIKTHNTCEARKYINQSIEVCMAANSYAQIFVEQNLTFNGGLMRRCRPLGMQSDDMEGLIVARSFAEVNTYKHICYTSMEYGARQKLAGYYIYTLRKIII